MVTKQYLSPLRQIYQFYAGRHQHRPERNPPMILSEWLEMLEQMGLYASDFDFQRAAAPYCFAVGLQNHLDEYGSFKHMEMLFVEMLVGISYVVFLKTMVWDPEGALELFAECFDEFLEEYVGPFYEQVQEWRGSNVSSAFGGKLTGFNVPFEWLQQVSVFLQALFHCADDDLSGELSLREFKTGLHQEEVKARMVELGLEPCHSDAFFSEVDCDGDGTLTLLEALTGFAKVKERLKENEKALGFFRHIFEKADADRSGFLTRDESLTSFAKPKVLERMRLLGMNFEINDFWDFLDTSGDGRLTLDEVQSGYVRFADPRNSCKEVIYLRQIFRSADDDGNGLLSRKEFVQSLQDPRVMDKMQQVGMGLCGSGEGGEQPTMEDIKEAVTLFFYELDTDFSGNLTCEEMIEGFLRIRETTRMNNLEKNQTLTKALNTTISSPTLPSYASLSSLPSPEANPLGSRPGSPGRERPRSPKGSVAPGALLRSQSPPGSPRLQPKSPKSGSRPNEASQTAAPRKNRVIMDASGKRRT